MKANSQDRNRSRTLSWLHAGALLLSPLLALGCIAESSVDQGEPNAAQTAEALRATRLCGGPRHVACPDNQFCRAIRSDHCLGPREFGICETRPDFCTKIYKPVCGCDGHTYGNACEASAAGIGIQHEGECAPKAPFCGGIAGIPCKGAAKCIDDPSDSCDPQQGGADCGGICVCVQNVLCIRGDHFDNNPAVCACVPDVCVQNVLCIQGSHFDSDPAVCACVPDVTDPCASVRCAAGTQCVANGGKATCEPIGVACGPRTCRADQICCSPSCGICGTKNGVCPQIACAPASP